MSKQIVFSMDTTGSMYPAIGQMRRSIRETVERLFREIPDLKVGVIAHGDYCDASNRNSYVTKTLDLTNDKASIQRFIETVGPTDGGDSAECYELVLNEARGLKWEAGGSKVLVMVGDDVPHPPTDPQNKRHLDWRNELNLLLEAGISVYAVQALDRSHATSFYAEVARKTNGLHMHLDQFHHVTDLIFAICYKQAGDKSLENFEREVRAAGRMDHSLDNIFGALTGKAPKKSRVTKTATSGLALRPVPPSRFQMLHVDSEDSIQGFVNKNSLIFHTGRGFYEMTKSVKVQAYKEIVLRDKMTGDMYTGPAARQMVGLPSNEDARLKPGAIDQYDVFVQSTSYNRKLLGGTKFLYEVDTTR